MIMAGVIAYLLVTGGAPFMSQPWHFYLLAVVVGLAQGGLQSLSRSYYAQLIPQREAGKYFGFYNMLGKASAVLGPFLMGWLALILNQRLSILAITVLLVAGFIVLLRLDDD